MIHKHVNTLSSCRADSQPQFIKCQRRCQYVKVPRHALQWLHLQRLLCTLSEDGLLCHTVRIVIIIVIIVVNISSCRTFHRCPLVNIITFHQYLQQRQESKEQDG